MNAFYLVTISQQSPGGVDLYFFSSAFFYRQNCAQGTFLFIYKYIQSSIFCWCCCGCTSRLKTSWRWKFAQPSVRWIAHFFSTFVTCLNCLFSKQQSQWFRMDVTNSVWLPSPTVYIYKLIDRMTDEFFSCFVLCSVSHFRPSLNTKTLGRKWPLKGKYIKHLTNCSNLSVSTVFAPRLLGR